MFMLEMVKIDDFSSLILMESIYISWKKRLGLIIGSNYGRRLLNCLVLRGENRKA